MLEGWRLLVQDPTLNLKRQFGISSPQTGFYVKQRVVKLLHHPVPTLLNFPKSGYRSIWMCRNVKEQAKSTLKFTMNKGEVPEADQDLDRIEKELQEEYNWNTDALSKLGPVKIVRFEKSCSAPASPTLLRGFCTILNWMVILIEWLP